jgi:hypothetical protein
MRIYAFGGGLDSAQGVGPNVVEVNSFYVIPIAGETPGCVSVNKADSYINIEARDPVTQAATSVTEAWIHFRHVPGYNGFGTFGHDGPVNYGIMRVRNSAGNVCLRIAITSTGDNFAWALQYGDGTTFTPAFTGVWSNRGVAAALDFHVKVDAATGIIEAFSEGVTIGSVRNINTSAMVNVSTVELTNCNDTGWGFWGWIIADQGSTVSHLCREKSVSGAGDEAAWTGTFTAIEAYPADTTSYISAPTAALKSNFTGTAFAALPTGHLIKAVGVGAYARNNGGTVTTLRGNLKIGGVDYPSPDVPGIIAGWGHARMLWPNDPSTAAPWTADLTNVNVSFGVESRT